MREVVIVDMARSAVGKHGGTIKDVPALDLIVQVAEVVVERNKSKVKPEMYDYVILGQVKQNTAAANIARNVSLKIGLPEEVPAACVTMACGSGLLSIEEGAEFIRNGFAEIILAGGVESMSGGEFFLSYNSNQAFGTGPVQLLDSIVSGGPGAAPVERYGNIPMGITAENLVDRFHISREEQDVFGLRSQDRALKAIANGDFEAEIVPIKYQKADGSTGTFVVDEYPRVTSMEALGKLKPAFKKDGTVTAGNSSGRNDGAAVALIMSREKADQLGIKPRARFVSAGIAGVDPTIMGRGPVPAVTIAMQKAGLTLKDIDAVELNEAFAGQSLAVFREWKDQWGVSDEWLDQHVNLWGGAIAIGHPLGGSGAIITTKLLHGLERIEGRYGLSTMCCGGGIGVAGIIERLA
ncbi:acetyl-CoA acetyltransferase [Desulfosporosinus orientis DSM 765]|uniref:Acetyl-CoA acetyltransferase n=1 Tax=Desulfosporosinus orientis (strain ATCC 19365 / DSM 765 / NCIMB 8382 / VKM B-1628 / Singapore I) TaxID=768706 RepID=G7WGR5_DESOD|nr:thiolase family protein [Desulfosporosinus orientis]AET68501.1 acetyl-CoA acetyltransferase [Desulfosporosinus orientis DSM 765]